MSTQPGNGLRADSADSSEGKVAVMGVLSCGSLGLLLGAVMVTILNMIYFFPTGNECPWFDAIVKNDSRRPSSKT
jgi:hypothetical protein